MEAAYTRSDAFNAKLNWMNHGSLFSGIGGFDLAASWMGWTNIFHCEWNPFCQKILKHYWPESISYDDICKTDFTIHRGQIDILTGGFPCQPYSVAGKRKGTEDSRHLWPEMLRAIRECKPTWILGENVPGIISWSEGLVFEQVCAELENEGYEVQPVMLPACGVNAPHKRDRIWIIAYSINNGNCDKPNRIQKESEGEGLEQQYKVYEPCESDDIRKDAANTQVKRGIRYSKREAPENSINGINGSNEYATNSKSKRLEGTNRKRMEGAIQPAEYITTNSDSGRQSSEEYRQTKSGLITETSSPGNWQDFPTVSPVLSGNDGVSYKLDSITFPKWRNESIKAAGNAIVPQVALQIFKVIEQMNK